MNRHIEAFKKFKAPWWSVLLGNWRARKAAKIARKKKHYVATITLWVKHISMIGQPELLTAFIHLYETGTGKRTFEFSKGDTTIKDVDSVHNYHSAVLPWLHGRFTNQAMIDYAKKTEITPKEWSK